MSKEDRFYKGKKLSPELTKKANELEFHDEKLKQIIIEISKQGKHDELNPDEIEKILFGIIDEMVSKSRNGFLNLIMEEWKDNLKRFAHEVVYGDVGV